jgi:hypothetical protein
VAKSNPTSDTDGGIDFSSLQDTVPSPPVIASIDGSTSDFTEDSTAKAVTGPMLTEPKLGFDLTSAGVPDDWTFQGAEMLSDGK